MNFGIELISTPVASAPGHAVTAGNPRRDKREDRFADKIDPVFHSGLFFHRKNRFYTGVQIGLCFYNNHAFLKFYFITYSNQSV